MLGLLSMRLLPHTPTQLQPPHWSSKVHWPTVACQSRTSGADVVVRGLPFGAFQACAGGGANRRWLCGGHVPGMFPGSSAELHLVVPALLLEAGLQRAGGARSRLDVFSWRILEGRGQAAAVASRCLTASVRRRALGADGRTLWAAPELGSRPQLQTARVAWAQRAARSRGGRV